MLFGFTLRALVSSLVLGLLLAFSGTARAQEPDVRTTWRLLDYIAVDYSAAVSNGQIADELEYKEMVEFSGAVAEQVTALPRSARRTALGREAVALRAAIAAKAPPEKVASVARELAAALLEAYPVPLAPSGIQIGRASCRERV